MRRREKKVKSIRPERKAFYYGFSLTLLVAGIGMMSPTITGNVTGANTDVTFSVLGFFFTFIGLFTLVFVSRRH